MHNKPVKNEDKDAYIKDVKAWADTYGYDVLSTDDCVSVYDDVCRLYIHKSFITGDVTYELQMFPETVSQFLYMQSVITKVYLMLGDLK